MQINSYSTNAHNKNLSFGKMHYDNESLAKLGAKFAMALEKAKPELEKRYGGKKIDVYLKHDPCGSNASQLIVRTTRKIKQEVNIPQNIIKRLFRAKPEKKVINEQLESSSCHFGLNLIKNKDELLNEVATSVKRARRNLRREFSEIRAQKILAKMN